MKQLYRPRQLKQLLASQGIKTSKSLSQNFLVDGNVIDNLILAANVESGEHILEIGPGPGAITEKLITAGADVIAVEIDRRLIQHLNTLGCEVIESDILTFPLEDQLKQRWQQKGKIVANLPFTITSPVLGKLLPLYDLISSVTVIIQKEVAERITAKPFSKDYSSLTVFANYFSTPKTCFSISRRSFMPAPKVDSAVVQFNLKQPYFTKSDQECFFKIVRLLFQQRRKTVRSILSNYYPKELLEAALVKISSHELARPEELSLEQFIAFYEQIGKLKD